MHRNGIKIAAVCCGVIASGLTTTSWAATSMSGSAQIDYIQYDAEQEGREIFSGSTLAQKYSLNYAASNLRHRAQQRYYDLRVGYDWLSFDTSANGLLQEYDLKDSAGKFKYSGEVGYNVDGLPIKMKAYINDALNPYFKYNLFDARGLMDDGLIYGMEGKGTSTTSGVTLVYQPRDARNIFLGDLPMVFFDYRQTVNKSSGIFNRVDYITKELAASLGQHTNWLNYRQTSFENSLLANDHFSEQQVQIGMVDYQGSRRWSTLTNWIEISADGQLTNVTSPSTDTAREEYDANLMVIASRKLWSARSFMNYNRLFEAAALTETARVPVYVKGIYGPDTDWYFSLGAIRQREKIFPENSTTGFTTSATNSITAGGTTFKRSNFTLSPSVSLTTTKDHNGLDSYWFESGLETASTRRFSDTYDLGGKVTFRTTDYGYTGPESKTWSTLMDLRSGYRPSSSVTVQLNESLEMGSGSGYLSQNRLLYGSTANDRVGTYLRQYLAVSLRLIPFDRLSVTMGGASEILQATDLPIASITEGYFRAWYDNQLISYRFDTKYEHRDNGYEPARKLWTTRADILYRPDRYHDGLFRLDYEDEIAGNIDRSTLEVLQRYRYNMFTRTGRVRNIATLTEESKYRSDENSGVKISSRYFMLSGRYNPTERLSLYGMVKYETNDPGSTVMYYNGGLSADFRLLSSSLDYAYAKRDKDGRIEKRLSATVTRTF